jgi:hypothetical protein
MVIVVIMDLGWRFNINIYYELFYLSAFALLCFESGKNSRQSIYLYKEISNPDILADLDLIDRCVTKTYNMSEYHLFGVQIQIFLTVFSVGAFDWSTIDIMMICCSLSHYITWYLAMVLKERLGTEKMGHKNDSD